MTLSVVVFRIRCFFLSAFLCFAALAPAAVSADDLESGWANPPPEARLRAYWWWLNGNVTKASITHDLEQMKAKGFGGAVIFDADGASQEGNDRVPHGPTFFTPEWRELYRHTLREGARLGLELSLNIQSGWNLGGPTVKPEDAAKTLVWTDTAVNAAQGDEHVLPEPKHEDPFYRDIFVVAFPLRAGRPAHPPLQDLAKKSLLKELPFSAPDTRFLLVDLPDHPGEEDLVASQVIDVTSHFGPDGKLHWTAPAGEWRVVRFGYTIPEKARVSTSSEGWKGYALDVLDTGAFKRYWDEIVEPLIADAGPLVGKTLRYLHTDSWEIEVINWTPSLREEFKARRGYDLLPYFPVLAGYLVDSRSSSNRFLGDFRKTIGDLAVDHHYKPWSEWAHQRGLELHPESGGPHGVPIDAQRCLGQDDMPMSEFWAWSWTHRIGDENRFFVKQPASAAHTYGHPLVAAEGFTTIGPHWQETLWDNLKPAFDHACAEGLNRLVWHAFVCSPEETGEPGQQYFAGTHLNPKVTWWDKSADFFTYLNRCQFLLQQGKFVADACYYYGDHVPNFAQLRSSDPAHLGYGYDYDVMTEEVLLERLSVKDGRLVLPDGMSYRVLVLPESTAISLPVLRKVAELARAGATILGPRPTSASSLSGFPKSDAEVLKIAEELWGGAETKGALHVIAGKTGREVLAAMGVAPDFEFRNGKSDTQIDYIHHQSADTNIYFVANRQPRPETISASFRVAGKAPEFWDAVTGERRFVPAYAEKDGRTQVEIELPPCGSLFVIFRESADAHPASAKRNFPSFTVRSEIAGPWMVSFDKTRGGPDARVKFDTLATWTTRPESGVRYYAGTAVYRREFDVAQGEGADSLYLDLGKVKELAEVSVNGQSLGVVWAPPFRVKLPRGLKAHGNQLEVAVVNFWPNRVIGDANLPPEERRTRTNIRKLTKDTPLMESGLLGPVTLQSAAE